MNEYGFKFELGQTVRHRAAIPFSWETHDDKGWSIGIGSSVCMVVLTQNLEVCSGGVQRHYKVRCVHHNGDISPNPILVHEEELVAVEEKPKTEGTKP